MSEKNEGAISQDEIDALLAGVPAEKIEKDKQEQEAAKERKAKATKKAKENIQKRIKESKAKSSSKSSDKESYGLSDDDFAGKNITNKKDKKQMSEVLSQDEIDRLLNAISSGNSDSESTPNLNIGNSRKIKIYDFKRPDRFSKEQVRSISYAFETFSRNMTAKLSSYLETLVHIYVASVDQLTFEEFIRSIPTPCSLCPAEWDTSDFEKTYENKYFTLTEIDPELALQILHGKITENINSEDSKNDIIKSIGRTTSYFESDILRRLIYTQFYEEITNCLNNMGTQNRTNLGFKSKKGNPAYVLKNPTLDHLYYEQNPQFAQIVPPNEMIMLITLEMKIRNESGMINICLPYPFVRDILIKGNILMTRSNTTNQEFGLQVLPGNATTSLGDFNIPEGAKLSEGLIIELPKLAGEPIDLVDKKTGKIFAKGEVVVIDENFGVRVTEVLDKSLEEPKEEK